MIGKEVGLLAKMGYLNRSVSAGIFRPLSDETREFIDQNYESPRKFSNPSRKVVKEEFYDLIREAQISRYSDSNYYVGEGNTKFSKGIHLAYWVAFTDQHQTIPPVDLVRLPKASDYIQTIISKSDKEKRQLTVSEQFATAMSLTDNRILDAILVAHIGSRAIARGCDRCLDKERFSFSFAQMAKWRDCVSFFGSLYQGKYGDPIGDTYHFWGTFVAGFTNELNITPKDKILNPIYKHLYLDTATATKVLRYTFTEPGATSLHSKADKFGYWLGTKVCRFIQHRTKLPAGNYSHFS